jgi:arylsulfatase
MPESLALTPREPIPKNPYNGKTGWAGKEIPAWNSLPEDRRRDLARRMAVYAGMVDHMDQAIGRVLAHLKSTGQEQNTVIFFLSDNGACAEWDPFGFNGEEPKTGEGLKRIGGPGSYVSCGTGWANACNTPLRLYKHYAHEGGVRTPFIVHWPAGLKAKGMVPGLGYITDFMPTIRELAGAMYPNQVGDIAIQPEEGVSLVPVFNGTPLAPRKIFMEHEGSSFVREGDWKLVHLNTNPKDSLELYNLASDPTEMNNLAVQEPKRVNEMAAAYQGWMTRCRRMSAQDKQ